MVNLENLNFADLLIRFRRLMPMKQASIVGLIFFVIYSIYNYFFVHLSLVESVSMATYSAIIFMVVYYFTSVVIMRKTIQMERQSKGPRKGLRNK